MVQSLTDEQLAPRAGKSSVARNELIRRFVPIVQQRSRMYEGVAVPQPAIYGEGLRLIQYAASTFKPMKGAKFSTHLENHLRRMSRYVNTHKNIARIPAAKQMRMGLFRSRNSSLRLRYGREPTPDELSADLGWSTRDVVDMMGLERRELSSSELQGEWETTYGDRMRETASFVRFELKPDQQVVFDYLFGKNGRIQTDNVQQLSAQSGVSTDKVYRTIRKIRGLMQQHL